MNFAYNKITTIQTHTFVDLPKLTMINLEDNAIDRIERRAFMNMKLLKYINLRGNKIKDITDESFQVLLLFSIPASMLNLLLDSSELHKITNHVQ